MTSPRLRRKYSAPPTAPSNNVNSHPNSLTVAERNCDKCSSAAVAALTNEPSATSSSVDQITTTEPVETASLGRSSDPTAAIIQSEAISIVQSEGTLYAHGFQDVPAAYVKQIQTGQFFDLAKLLPSNYDNLPDSKQVTLTLENSVLKIKKSSQCVARITKIKPLATAFSTTRVS